MAEDEMKAKVSFKWNTKALEKVVNDGLKSRARDLQEALDQVARTYQGQSLAVIESALKSELVSRDFTLSAEQVGAWAQAIHAGTKIVVQAEDIKL